MSDWGAQRCDIPVHHSPNLVQQANAAALPFVFSACPVPCSRRRAVARVAMDLESERAGAPADADAPAPLGERTMPHTSFFLYCIIPGND